MVADTRHGLCLRVTDTEHVIDKRPQADRLLVAEIHGEARHHAKWRDLTEAEEAAAVAELRELAGGQADLLAEVAGILEGAHEGELDEPLTRQAADMCRKAGADPDAIPAWIAEGRRRKANAGRPPFSESADRPGPQTPKLSRRGDAERTGLAGGVPARSPPAVIYARRIRRAPGAEDAHGGFCRGALVVVDASLACLRDLVTRRDVPRASSARARAGCGGHDQHRGLSGRAGRRMLRRIWQ